VRSATIVLVVCVFTGPAFALEPVGCDKFKWPLDKERATLNGTDLPKLMSADRVAWPIPWATTLALVPFADAKLPVAPERAPKSPETFAGFIQVVAPAQAGTYKVTLSSEGWIDVAQDGRVRKSLASSGATGCEGIRKSVKFELATAPFIIEISGATVHTIAIVVTPE
jgi:hypothetical protein